MNAKIFDISSHRKYVGHVPPENHEKHTSVSYQDERGATYTVTLKAAPKKRARTLSAFDFSVGMLVGFCAGCALCCII